MYRLSRRLFGSFSSFSQYPLRGFDTMSSSPAPQPATNFLHPTSPWTCSSWLRCRTWTFRDVASCEPEDSYRVLESRGSLEPEKLRKVDQSNAVEDGSLHLRSSAPFGSVSEGTAEHMHLEGCPFALFDSFRVPPLQPARPEPPRRVPMKGHPYLCSALKKNCDEECAHGQTACNNKRASRPSSRTSLQTGWFGW